MSPLTVRLLRAAFLCLALGTGLGLSFALDRALGPRLRFLHAELNLWGWTTLLIYGMAYHMLPRFAGQPLRLAPLAELQSWAAMVGVVVTAAGWSGERAGLPMGRLFLTVGGSLQLAAALLFVALMGDLLVRGARRERPSPAPPQLTPQLPEGAPVGTLPLRQPVTSTKEHYP